MAAAVFGLMAAVTFGLHTHFGSHYVRGTAGDLGGPLEGARRLRQGWDDIYAEPYALYSNPYPLSYPLTASIVVAPLAGLPPATAGICFTALTTGAAAFFLTRRRLDQASILLSAPAFFAWAWGQWSPLLLVSAVVPAAAAFGLCKPQLGMPLFLARPSRIGAVAAAAFFVLSWVLQPTWPGQWLRMQLGSHQGFAEHHGALFVPGGFLLLAAMLRWRDPAARLLVAMTVLPCRLWFYDQLILGLIPQTRQRRLVWIAASWAAALGWVLLPLFPDWNTSTVRQTILVALTYGPALFFVLVAPPSSTETILSVRTTKS